MHSDLYFFERKEIVWPELWMNFREVPEIHGSKETLTEWLTIDVRDHEEYLAQVEDVLNGTKSDELIWGDAYKAFINPDVSEVHCCFEEELPDKAPCMLPTTLLRDIIAIWLKEYKKFKEEEPAK